MDESELRKALTQTLENFQRCGVRRIYRDPLQASTARQAIDQWREHCQPTPTEQVTSTPMVQEPLDQTSHNAPNEAQRLNDAEILDEDQLLDEDQRWKVLRDLDAKVKACRLCADICRHRQQTVFGCGPVRPTVCFMGEAPGADEDQMGQPFVGRAGQLLTKIITAMQLRREDVYILNSLKCRPPGHRTPTDQELANCRPFVQAQLQTLKPKYIVCLGSVAVRSLLNQTTTIGKLRGQFFDYSGAKVVVTYHPAYLLRNEQAKRLVWEDMQMLMREMGISIPK